MLNILSLFMVLHVSSAQTPTPTPTPPVTLQALPTENFPTFNDDPTPVTCDQLYSAITTYSQNVAQNEQAMIGFISDIANTASNWYSQLWPLEGQTETLPVGTFSVINQGVSQIQTANGLASQNASALDADLAAIVTAVQNCVPTPSSVRR